MSNKAFLFYITFSLWLLFALRSFGHLSLNHGATTTCKVCVILTRLLSPITSGLSLLTLFLYIIYNILWSFIFYQLSFFVVGLFLCFLLMRCFFILFLSIIPFLLCLFVSSCNFVISICLVTFFCN